MNPFLLKVFFAVAVGVIGVVATSYFRNRNSEQRVQSYRPVIPTSQKDCPICLNEVNSEKVRLPCYHLMHLSCFKDFIAHEGTRTVCPFCRTPITENFVLNTLGSRLS